MVMGGALVAAVAPCGLGNFSTHLGVFGQRRRGGEPGGRAAVRVALNPQDTTRSGCQRCVSSASLNLWFQNESKLSHGEPAKWFERITDLELGKTIAPIAATATFYLQAAAPSFAEEVEVSDSVEKTIAVWVTWGIMAFLYFLVIPAITYNYLRLRWYKRNAPETYFQFMLVFIFFPGMLLMAPFINFRRLPKEGTEPP